jgi:hypothetical protein
MKVTPTFVGVRELIMKYIVKNIYGITGESKHNKPEAAVKAAKNREGTGWVVEDENGIRWWIDNANNIYRD